MSVHELVTLVTHPGVGRRLADDLQDGLSEQETGRLLAAWVCEFGVQNRVVIWREFVNEAEMAEARAGLRGAPDPFKCGAWIEGILFESFAPFPDFQDVRIVPVGPYFEIRTYVLPVGGLEPTLAAWTEMVPRRSIVSRPIMVMYALDGHPRFTHIWPYKDLKSREELREEAVRTGVWPPNSAPKWLTADMKSELFVPFPFSPLK